MEGRQRTDACWIKILLLFGDRFSDFFFLSARISGYCVCPAYEQSNYACGVTNVDICTMRIADETQLMYNTKTVDGYEKK